MQHTQRSSYEAERGTRFARRVLVAGIAAFSALAAMVQTKRGEAIDRTIAARVQANNDPRIERAMTLVSWFGIRRRAAYCP